MLRPFFCIVFDLTLFMKLNKRFIFDLVLLAVFLVLLRYITPIVIRAIEVSHNDNYGKCKTLKTGMTQKEVAAIMGEPDGVINVDVGPQKGKKLLVYNNPSHMDDNNNIYVDTNTFQANLIYCSNVKIE